MKDDKLVLISGSGRGLGASIAESFANKGYKVAINYFKSEKQAHALADKLFSSKFNSILISLIFLGSALIIFVIFAVELGILNPPFSAHIPITVVIQLQRADDTKSVGAKACPFPLLSVGASVVILSFESKCVDTVLKFPMYLFSIE